MSGTPYDIAALLGSRICHDLISPLGAIGNGVELLSMTGMSDGAEMSLISDSVDHANARIRYFRIAFGAGSDVNRIGRTEIATVLEDLAKTSKLGMAWEVPGDITRNEAKLAFLLMMCLETAMPYGGNMRVALDGAHWSVTGTADKLKIDPDLWQVLSAPSVATPEITPAQVQFLLAADLMKAHDPRPCVQMDSTRIEISY